MNSIVSHIISFAIGLTTGILGSYVANRLSEKAKKKDKIKDRKNEFKAITATYCRAGFGGTPTADSRFAVLRNPIDNLK